MREALKHDLKGCSLLLGVFVTIVCVMNLVAHVSLEYDRKLRSMPIEMPSENGTTHTQTSHELLISPKLPPADAAALESESLQAQRKHWKEVMKLLDEVLKEEGVSPIRSK